MSDFPLFAALTEILSLRIEQKLKGAKNQTEPNRFPPIFTNQKSHTTQLSQNCLFLIFLRTLMYLSHADMVHFEPTKLLTNSIYEVCGFRWLKKCEAIQSVSSEAGLRLTL